MTIGCTGAIGHQNRQVQKKKVRFASSVTQNVAWQIVNKCRNEMRKKGQTGGSIIGNLAKWGITIGVKPFE